MRKLLVIALVLGIVGVASAYDLGAKLPAKATPVVPENVPSADRQGGDDVFSATVIPALPYSNSGTTSGYSDDYDEVCPYMYSTSPDVVYTYTCVGTEILSVDLCGSDYDTKTYIYDANYNLIACNDDYWYDATCGYYTSLIEGAVCSGQIYIVVDGYGGDYGNYVINVIPFVPCDLICPPAPPGVSWAEGEPPLVDNYVDNWNGGCNTAGYPFQDIFGLEDGTFILCGVSGWYYFNGNSYRDTDWFALHVGPGGMVEVTADAEHPSYIFQLGPTDCNFAGITQQATMGDCLPGYMSLSGTPGQVVWFWVGPQDWDQSLPDYEYIVWFTGLEPGIATQPATWGSVKALFE